MRDRDDYKPHEIDRPENRAPQKGTVERILTPGQTTNNIIKTIATGIIMFSTMLIMMIYGWLR